jgi:hypothetical protein
MLDPRDHLALKVMLAEDGTGITYIAKLSCPTFFSKEAKDMHDEKLTNKKGLPCDKRMQAPQVTATSIQSKDERCLQRVHLNFPKGLTYKAFTDGRKGKKLKKIFPMVEVKIGEEDEGNNLHKVAYRHRWGYLQRKWPWWVVGTVLRIATPIAA